MKTRLSRREATKWMLSAAIGGLAQTTPNVTAAISPDAAGSVNFEPVRSRIHQAIEQGKATGLALALVHGGRILWEEGFGWANRETGVKATPHTPFSMASITKPFTATTIMTLVATGKLSLDEPANQYLADSKIIGTNGNANAATVRLLGAHASGLPGIYESYEVKEANLIPSPDAVMQAYGRLAYPPATCYEYSNIGFAALNAIASALTQTEFGQLMHQRVLAPLGLSDSFFGSNIRRVNTGASRYDPQGRLIPHYRTSTPASGELYASAHDLARFARFNMGHRDQGQVAILSKHDLDEIHQPVFTGPSGVASTFGWFMSHTASGVPFYFKTGGDPGVANRMCFVPSKDLACVVVTNQSNSGELAFSVIDELITKFLPDWQRPDEDCGPPSKPFLATPAFQGSWQGTLQNDGANIPVLLNIESSQAATLTIGASPAQTITGMRAEGQAFTGLSSAQINSPDAIRTGARTLQIKLLPHEQRLIGRIAALSGDPNVKSARLPYVLTLRRN